MIEHLSKASFKSEIFDWEKGEAWKFSGELPAVVDFYAEWCMPCKMLGPILEELAEKYEGKIRVYKIDVDREPELAGLFGVQSVPTLLFIPRTGDPKISLGALPKPQLERTIGEILLAS
jgi:thioredoxin 1